MSIEEKERKERLDWFMFWIYLAALVVFLSSCRADAAPAKALDLMAKPPPKAKPDAWARSETRPMAPALAEMTPSAMVIQPATNACPLAWDASPSLGVVGYRIHHGMTSGVYTNVWNIGNQLSVTLTNLPKGTNFMAATAVDASGLESDLSNEVWFRSALAATNPPPQYRWVWWAQSADFGSTNWVDRFVMGATTNGLIQVRIRTEKQLLP